MAYKYNNYINQVSTRFQGQLDQIASYYNFDLGDEYEIALCKALRATLPERFGICRGFVVTAEGEKAGDDIIIYARDRFPTIRPIEDADYSLKQQIPVEAVYAYIEAKHTLTIEAEGGQSLHKASSQVKAVRELPREVVSIDNAFHPYVALKGKVTLRKNFPKLLNPLYGAIIARQIRLKPGSKLLKTGARIMDAFTGKSADTDLLIAGRDVVFLPFIDESGLDTYHSPFGIENISHLRPWHKPGLAFGIGICSLFYALDTIILGKVSWPSIIADSLGIPTN